MVELIRSMSEDSAAVAKPLSLEQKGNASRLSEFIGTAAGKMLMPGFTDLRFSSYKDVHFVGGRIITEAGGAAALATGFMAGDEKMAAVGVGVLLADKFAGILTERLRVLKEAKQGGSEDPSIEGEHALVRMPGHLARIVTETFAPTYFGAGKSPETGIAQKTLAITGSAELLAGGMALSTGQPEYGLAYLGLRQVSHLVQKLEEDLPKAKQKIQELRARRAAANPQAQPVVNAAPIEDQAPPLTPEEVATLQKDDQDAQRRRELQQEMDNIRNSQRAQKVIRTAAAVGEAAKQVVREGVDESKRLLEGDKAVAQVAVNVLKGAKEEFSQRREQEKLDKQQKREGGLWHKITSWFSGMDEIPMRDNYEPDPVPVSTIPDTDKLNRNRNSGFKPQDVEIPGAYSTASLDTLSAKTVGIRDDQSNDVFQGTLPTEPAAIPQSNIDSIDTSTPFSPAGEVQVDGAIKQELPQEPSPAVDNETPNDEGVQTVDNIADQPDTSAQNASVDKYGNALRPRVRLADLLREEPKVEAPADDEEPFVPVDTSIPESNLPKFTASRKFEPEPIDIPGADGSNNGVVRLGLPQETETVVSAQASEVNSNNGQNGHNSNGEAVVSAVEPTKALFDPSKLSPVRETPRPGRNSTTLVDERPDLSSFYKNANGNGSNGVVQEPSNATISDSFANGIRPELGTLNLKPDNERNIVLSASSLEDMEDRAKKLGWNKEDIHYAGRYLESRLSTVNGTGGGSQNG